MTRSKPLLVAAMTATALLTLPTIARAQSASPRADATGYVGWFNANQSDVASDFNDWGNRSLSGGVGLTWHWSEHLQTGIEFAGVTPYELYGEAEVPRPGAAPARAFLEHTFSSRTLSLLHSYQFLHNAWVHPIVGGGIELDWERHSTFRYPVFDTVPVGGRFESRLVLPEQRTGADTKLRVHAVGTVGFKAYFTQRAYFRSDLKLSATRQMDHVVLRAGIGVEF